MRESMSIRYDAELKRSAVKLALESEKPYAQTARELGINEKTLYNWIDHYRKHEAPSAVIAEHEELRRLRKELAEVKMERDILKKATAYFAKHSR